MTDIDAMREAVEGQEYVIHLAAETGTGQSMYQINQYNETNIMGTSNLLQAISLLGKQNTVKKIVLSSSRSVYGEGKYECPHCGVVYPKGRAKEKMLAGDFNFYCPACGGKLKLLSPRRTAWYSLCPCTPLPSTPRKKCWKPCARRWAWIIPFSGIRTCTA